MIDAVEFRSTRLAESTGVEWPFVWMISFNRIIKCLNLNPDELRSTIKLHLIPRTCTPNRLAIILLLNVPPETVWNDVKELPLSVFCCNNTVFRTQYDQQRKKGHPKFLGRHHIRRDSSLKIMRWRYWSFQRKRCSRQYFWPIIADTLSLSLLLIVVARAVFVRNELSLPHFAWKYPNFPSAYKWNKIERTYSAGLECNRIIW